MDLQDNLIESSKKRKKRSWAPIVSVAAHAALITAIVIGTAQSTQKADAHEKPIRAFIAQGAAPPPPPPPPPPAGAAAPRPVPTPKIARIEPKQVTPQTFVQPREIPKEVPELQPMTSASNDEPTETTPTPQLPTTPAVTGGVAGGVAGGVEGGTVGGVLGGEKGGVVGGTPGGKVGGTGSGTEGEGTGGKEADAGPLRVGGDVKAPVAIERAEPEYTEAARHARISGVVIVEAIINRQGEVEQVRVLKPLPGGLAEKAEEAVKRWRFRPGTQNGQPVDVIFNLTVTFKLDA